MVKHKKGQLELPKPPLEFIAQARADLDLLGLSMQERAVFRLSELPPIHKDPWDRMLVCQALAHRLILITCDADLRMYPVPTVW